MPNVCAIAQGSLAIHLGLAGLHVEQPASGETVEAILDAMLNDADAYTLVIVQEVYRRDFSEWFLERLKHHKGRPLVVFCPDYSDDTIDPNSYVTAILKPVLGFELRLE